MSLIHSPNLHSSLIARIPVVTGRDLAEWFHRLESGPAFLRREERAHWLADDAGISCGYAYAIVHEYEMRRRLRLNGGTRCAGACASTEPRNSPSERPRPAENPGRRVVMPRAAGGPPVPVGHSGWRWF